MAKAAYQQSLAGKQKYHPLYCYALVNSQTQAGSQITANLCIGNCLLRVTSKLLTKQFSRSTDCTVQDSLLRNMQKFQVELTIISNHVNTYNKY